MTKIRHLVSFSFLLVSLSAPGVRAQVLTSLRGIVTEMTGAVVPRAEVTLLNRETGFRRVVQTQSDGSYAIFDIPPGTYLMQCSASGFKTVNLENVELRVDLPATMNVSFNELGTVAESISVVAATTPLNTTDASLGNTLGTTPVLQLPMDSRNVVGLLQLQPGVTSEGAVNGGREDQGNITLDGADVNEQQNRTAFTSVIRTPLDSVQEFRVTTLNAPADEGRTGGAQVVLVTKSGTNQLHGSAYEYNRNTKFAANNYFNNLIGLPIPKLNRNLFGGSLGGPVLKNKLFYFSNFETTIDASEGVGALTVPTDHLRQGSLWYPRTDGTIAQLSPDQVRSLVDPGHIGPDPAILQILNKFPEPNNPYGGDGVNTLGYNFRAPVHSHLRTYVARIDYMPSTSSIFFFRGTLDNDRTPGLPNAPGQIPASVLLSNSKGIAAGYTNLLKPNLTNILRYGLTREGTETTGAIAAGTKQAFHVSNGLGLAEGLYPTTTDFSRIVPTHTFTDDMTWVKGTHTFQFGGAFRVIRNRTADYSYLEFAGQNVYWLPNCAPELTQNLPDMSPLFAKCGAFPQTAVDVLGMLTISLSNYLYDKSGNLLPIGAPKDRNFAGNEFEVYFQDSWRATRALTLTAGLRWSLFPPIHEANGFQASLFPSADIWLKQRQALAAAGLPQSMVPLLAFNQGGELYHNHYKNFGPRLSLAYSPQTSSGWLGKLAGGPGRTVIRAGGGLFYDLYGQGLMLTADQSNLGFSATQIGSARALTAATAPRIQAWNQIPADMLIPAPPGGFPKVFPLTPPRGIRPNQRNRPQPKASL